MSNPAMSNAAGKIFMNLVMLGIFSVMVFIATDFPPDARFMPFVVGIPGIVMCAVQLLLEIAGLRRAAKDEDDDGRSEIERAEAEVSRIVGRRMDFHEAEGPQAVVVEENKEGRVRREVVMWGWFLALIAGILLFGFWITVPLFIFSFLRFFAGRSWGFALLLAAVASTILYCAVVLGLKVVLHEGFIVEAVKEHFNMY